jgi:hypothetical protein
VTSVGFPIGFAWSNTSDHGDKCNGRLPLTCHSSVSGIPCTIYITSQPSDISLIRHPNYDLGFARPPRQPRAKRSAPGEGQRALRKKAKLLASERETSASTPGAEEPDGGEASLVILENEVNGDVGMDA